MMVDAAKECDPRKQGKAGLSQQPLLNSPKSTVHIDSTTAPRSVGETVSSTASVDTSNDSKRPSSSSTATKKEEAEAAAANHLYVLTQLARQLEYYFSTQNLSKDTYVQTLRSLNDGCVPVSILANFSKVKLLLRGVTEEEERLHAVLQASTEHSEGLRVVSIDTGSGKIVTDETPSSADTILAIGTHDNEPLQAVTTVTSAAATATLSPPMTPVLPPPSPGSSTNTLILRDVIQQVTEEEIRALFTFEGCPTVESIHQDVANCWFVRLETEDRFAMVKTMMQVQAQTLAGYPVHARLKASATSTVPIDTAPPMPVSCWLPGANDLDAAATATTKSKSARKKSRRNRKGRRKNKNNNNNSTEKKDSKDSDEDKSSSSSEKKEKSVTAAPEAPKSPSVNPPSLDEDNFPTLQEKKVEWETISEEDSTSSKGDMDEDDKGRQDDDEDDEEERSEERVVDRVEEAPRSSLLPFSKATFLSDGASTATTTSSSTDSFPKKTLVMPVGGYAAALMTAPPAKPVVPKATTGTVADKSKPQEQRQDKYSATKGEDDIAAATAAAGPPPMVVKPPSWGQGRSFADILRKD